jgi:hypothetical protein
MLHQKKNTQTPLIHIKFDVYLVRHMKAKGQQNPVAKPELLALALVAGWQSWSNATGLHPADGARPTIQGFESLTRRHFSLPSDGANHHQGEKRTAEAARIRKFSIRLLAVNRKEIHGDLSQLFGRYGEGRKGPKRNAAL